MAHFAKLNENNEVVQVLVVADTDAPTEEAGQAFLQNLYKNTITYKQTSYNTFAGEHKLGGTPFRKNYATVGGTYDEDRDAFIGPKPYASAVLNETTCQWEAPIPHPDPNTTSVRYNFNPETNSWEEISRE